MRHLNHCSIKHNDETLLNGIQTEFDHMELNVSLRYVCISTSQIFPVVNDELKLSPNEMKFSFLSNLETTKAQNIAIQRQGIKNLQYSDENNLLRITLQSETYIKYFCNQINEEDLFKDSIWFCLTTMDPTTYKTIIDYLHNNYLPTLNVSAMPTDIYEQFKTLLTPRLFHDILTTPEAVKPERKRRLLKRMLAPVVIGKLKRPRAPTTSCRKLLYSPTHTRSIEIIESDLLCLMPKKYLNDNIINLYLTYIYHQKLTPQQQEVTYFFNVFFCTKLVGSIAQQKIDTPETRHARVAKWTKNVDIFSKDFVVIPVYEQKHWFLTIVCFSWMAGIFNYAELFKSTQKIEVDIPVNTSTFATTTRQKRCSKMITEQKISPMPCILVFDSLACQNRSGKVNIIREYLKSEWDSKRKAQDGPLIFDRTTCRGYSPVVLKQNNGTDCGLYLLQYVEMFFKKPLQSYQKEVFMAGFCDWFGRGVINDKREEMKSTIVSITTEICSDDGADDAIKYSNI